MSCFSADVRGGDEKHCIKSHNHNTGDMTSLMAHFPTEDTNNKNTTDCSMLRKTDAKNDSGLGDV